MKQILIVEIVTWVVLLVECRDRGSRRYTPSPFHRRDDIAFPATDLAEQAQAGTPSIRQTRQRYSTSNKVQPSRSRSPTVIDSVDIATQAPASQVPLARYTPTQVLNSPLLSAPTIPPFFASNIHQVTRTSNRTTKLFTGNDQTRSFGLERLSDSSTNDKTVVRHVQVKRRRKIVKANNSANVFSRKEGTSHSFPNNFSQNITVTQTALPREVFVNYRRAAQPSAHVTFGDNSRGSRKPPTLGRGRSTSVLRPENLTFAKDSQEGSIGQLINNDRQKNASQKFISDFSKPDPATRGNSVLSRTFVIPASRPSMPISDHEHILSTRREKLNSRHLANKRISSRPKDMQQTQLTQISVPGEHRDDDATGINVELTSTRGRHTSSFGKNKSFVSQNGIFQQKIVSSIPRSQSHSMVTVKRTEFSAPHSLRPTSSSVIEADQGQDFARPVSTSSDIRVENFTDGTLNVFGQGSFSFSSTPVRDQEKPWFASAIEEQNKSNTVEKASSHNSSSTDSRQHLKIGNVELLPHLPSGGTHTNTLISVKPLTGNSGTYKAFDTQRGTTQKISISGVDQEHFWKSDILQFKQSRRNSGNLLPGASHIVNNQSTIPSSNDKHNPFLANSRIFQFDKNIINNDQRNSSTNVAFGKFPGSVIDRERINLRNQQNQNSHLRTRKIGVNIAESTSTSPAPATFRNQFVRRKFSSTTLRPHRGVTRFFGVNTHKPSIDTSPTVGINLPSPKRPTWRPETPPSLQSIPAAASFDRQTYSVNSSARSFATGSTQFRPTLSSPLLAEASSLQFPSFQQAIKNVRKNSPAEFSFSLGAVSNSSPRGFHEEVIVNQPSLVTDYAAGFTCEGKDYGYYADILNNCHVFHICQPVDITHNSSYYTRYSFVCGPETIFDQSKLSCLHEREAVACNTSEQWLHRNDDFGAAQTPSSTTSARKLNQ